MALTRPTSTMISRPQVFNAYDAGAGRGGDDTAIIQGLMDEAIGPNYSEPKPTRIEFPWTPSGYNVTGLDFKTSNIHLVGIGGHGFAQASGVTINFIGDGADEAAIIRADKSLHNASQNYQGNLIENFVLDGQGKALHGLKLNGWTRYCNVRRVTVTRCVNQIKVDDGFYSVWDDVEIQINQTTPPAGMLQATFDANLYGAVFHICHAMHIKSLKIFEINGTSGANFDTALRFSECDAAQVDVLTIEGCDYVRTGIDIAPGCNVAISTVYSEANRFTERWVRVNDNAQAAFTNHYINDVRAPILFHIGEMVGVVFNALSGFNLDCATAAFKAISGSMLRNVKFAGPVSLQVGAQDGTIVDASTTAFSDEGIPSDGIILYGVASGDYITGYGATLGATYIEVGAGTANANGQVVGWGRVSSAKQRLYPDLSFTGNWVLKISGCGLPYIEKASAAKIGSAESISIATFSTPGGGGAPSGLA